MRLGLRGLVVDLVLGLVVRLLAEVLARVVHSDERLARIEQLLARALHTKEEPEPSGEDASSKLDAVLRRIEGFDAKLDEVQAGMARFRPSAVWTLEEAAEELRMSPGQLRERQKKGDIKAMVREKSKEAGRGKRGEAISFLYEEIQRFKGYRG